MKLKLSILMCLFWIFTAAADTVTVHYNGLSKFDPAGFNGLRNPERGFRLESILGMGSRQAPWQSPVICGRMLGRRYNGNWQVLNFSAFESANITLSQHYCYLTEFSNEKKLPEYVLTDLEKAFQQLRELGVKSVLRFAYETEIKPMGKGLGPSLENLLSHMDQLKPLLENNQDVIYLLEVGFLGTWGEWHNMQKIHWADYSAKAEIVKKSLEVLPQSRMITIRSPYHLKTILNTPLLTSWDKEVSAQTAFTATPIARIGFHNDGFGVYSDESRCVEGKPQKGTPLFDLMQRSTYYTPSGGEMWWRLEGGKMDGKDAILRLRAMHYDVFSLIHSFDQAHETDENFNRWQRETISIDWVKSNNLPLSNNYFDSVAKEKTTRTAFDYIRDHLGYRFEMQKAAWTHKLTEQATFKLDAELINRGFKSLINKRTAYIVLVDSNGDVVLQKELDSDPRKWFPYKLGDSNYTPLRHKIAIEFSLPDNITNGEYLVGLWLPDEDQKLRKDSRYAIRFANRDFFWFHNQAKGYGINVFGKLMVEPISKN